ncbi:glycosyltransferase family 2 protein [Flavobacterium sp. YJ01]|uniref:glycosyltransferase family 2 protein n=1 Tax=unclassified Flavobacterium TaxID=196869 RepID=UPI0023E38F74|nr:glycosyltransferase family 2 protein [Flavobacterium sp. YJ01]WET01230.1 glycosyltransferase family 2 protein [Flavobacterium sp. YJ01]
MQIKKSNVLIIIVTYNGEKWIRNCLDSIMNSNYLADIFIVDNASIDNTVAILDLYEEIKIYKSNVNLGFGKANNLGLTYALQNDYDYAFLLNQDTWIEKDTIEDLVAVAQKQQDFGIISPMHYFSDKISLEYNFSVQLSPWFCKNILSDFVFRDQKSMKEIYPLNFVNAAAWLLPRRTLEIVGGFDPLFFHYGEDNDYCNRLKYHKLKIGIAPHAKIYHDCLDSNNKNLDTEKQLRKFEIEQKVALSNINLRIKKSNIIGLSLKLLLIAVINFFTFNFKKSKMSFKKCRIVVNSYNGIITSRKNNVLSKSNYL